MKLTEYELLQLKYARLELAVTTQTMQLKQQALDTLFLDICKAHELPPDRTIINNDGSVQVIEQLKPEETQEVKED